MATYIRITNADKLSQMDRDQRAALRLATEVGRQQRVLKDATEEEIDSRNEDARSRGKRRPFEPMAARHGSDDQENGFVSQVWFEWVRTLSPREITLSVKPYDENGDLVDSAELTETIVRPPATYDASATPPGLGGFGDYAQPGDMPGTLYDVSPLTRISGSGHYTNYTGFWQEWVGFGFDWEPVSAFLTGTPGGMTVTKKSSEQRSVTYSSLTDTDRIKAFFLPGSAETSYFVVSVFDAPTTRRYRINHTYTLESRTIWTGTFTWNDGGIQREEGISTETECTSWSAVIDDGDPADTGAIHEVFLYQVGVGTLSKLAVPPELVTAMRVFHPELVNGVTLEAGTAVNAITDGTYTNQVRFPGTLDPEVLVTDPIERGDIPAGTRIGPAWRAAVAYDGESDADTYLLRSFGLGRLTTTNHADAGFSSCAIYSFLAGTGTLSQNYVTIRPQIPAALRDKFLDYGSGFIRTADAPATQPVNTTTAMDAADFSAQQPWGNSNFDPGKTYATWSQSPTYARGELAKLGIVSPLRIRGRAKLPRIQ